MGREMYDIQPKIYPTPPLLKDFTGMHKGWGTVVGYAGKTILKINASAHSKQSRRRHKWACHCSKCNRFFKLNHQNLGSIFTNSSNDFICHSCKGKMTFNNK